MHCYSSCLRYSPKHTLTRKSSCVTASGVSPAPYPVHGVSCLGGYPCLGPVLGRGRGFPCLRTWLEYPSPPARKDLRPETMDSPPLSRKRPGTRHHGLSAWESTWDQRPGSTPSFPSPPTPQWTRAVKCLSLCMALTHRSLKDLWRAEKKIALKTSINRSRMDF